MARDQTNLAMGQTCLAMDKGTVLEKSDFERNHELFSDY